MGVSSTLTFAVILRQYPESVSVLRILQPDAGGGPVIEYGALVAVHELEDGTKQRGCRLTMSVVEGLRTTMDWHRSTFESTLKVERTPRQRQSDGGPAR